MPHELKIVFPNEALMREFASWLSNSGEQDYFTSRELVNAEPRSLRFGYHGPENEKYPRNDRRRYGPFLCDNTIRVEVIPEE